MTSKKTLTACLLLTMLCGCSPSATSVRVPIPAWAKPMPAQPGDSLPHRPYWWRVHDAD